ncbi:MAG: RsmB/NOP family class I SAM-dependent RNA methyltransferase [Nanoarchaeota archaeon]|nr:RsmB/NOP family class I SAM-dependent RNA methyltransferase [Nanoarchaeota archaeon]
MVKKQYKYDMKPLFEERMRTLLPDGKDFESYDKIIHQEPLDFIRCNTLKITPAKLLERLNKKWKVVQPFKDFPEIMLVEEGLGPGDLGNSIEHQLGYFYVQELSSMLSVLALDPKPEEFVLDLCASPGSKTTQIAARMENTGTIVANDLKLGRVMILASNLDRCGVTNAVVTRNDAISVASRISKSSLPKFDRVLVDAPCSGEGTIRSSPRTLQIWNKKVVDKFSRQQKKFVSFALKCLKKGGVLVYSTCTHAPEENESVVSFILENFPVKAETLRLPVKTRPGILTWNGEEFNEDTCKACRIYPQDNDTEGFFVSKFTLLEEVR